MLQNNKIKVIFAYKLIIQFLKNKIIVKILLWWNKLIK